MESLGRERSSSLVQQAAQETGEAGTVCGILRRAAEQREFKAHQRHGVILDMPDLDPGRRGDAGYPRAMRRRRHVEKTNQERIRQRPW